MLLGDLDADSPAATGASYRPKTEVDLRLDSLIQVGTSIVSGANAGLMGKEPPPRPFTIATCEDDIAKTWGPETAGTKTPV